MAASEVRPSETREEQTAEQRGRQEIQGQAKDEKTDDDEATTADGQVSTPVGWQRNRRDTLSQESGEAIYKAWQLTELKNRGKEKIANGRISTSTRKTDGGSAETPRQQQPEQDTRDCNDVPAVSDGTQDYHGEGR